MGAINIGRGTVYAVLFTDGSVKIGMTRNIKKRIAALNTHSPYAVCRYICGDNDFPKETESALHELFKEKRTHGEFFTFEKEDWKKLLIFLDADEWAENNGFYKDLYALYDSVERVTK